MVFDFHTHTFYSDGALSPVEQARRAAQRGYQVLGLTDHVGVGGVREIMRALKDDRDLVERYWPLKIIIGVELTHVPAAGIAEAAARAREAGAEIVVLHGETLVEPVEPGSDHAAIMSGMVDVIGHPGPITEEDVREAAARDVYLEISARSGHCLANGHVAALAQRLGARLIVNSDAHAPSDLLTPDFQRAVALGAGIDEGLLASVLNAWPEDLLRRCLARRAD